MSAKAARATGPHLHYEVLVNNAQVNPMSVKFKAGSVLAGRDPRALQIGGGGSRNTPFGHAAFDASGTGPPRGQLATMTPTLVGAWLLGAVWVAFMLFQGRAARRAAPTAQRAKDALYPINLLAVILGLILMLTSVGDLWVFGIRILPDEPEWFWLGFAITGLGLGIAVWARRRLGPFWASAIEIKTGHRLIQDGPPTVSCATRSMPASCSGPWVRASLTAMSVAQRDSR